MAVQEKADPFINLRDSIYQISTFIISKIMYVTPFGVFACIATVMYSNGVDTMLQSGQVLLALYITFYLYAFIIYGGMVKFFGKYSPIQIFKDIAPAGLNAFGTCSSSATISISLNCATEKNWHSRRNYFVDSSFRDNYRYGCSFDFDVIDDHILCDCTWY